MANIYDMADTWNDVGTTFTAIKMDVTDTASAAGSLLMDLQVGGSSKLSVSKDGHIGIEVAPSASFSLRASKTLLAAQYALSTNTGAVYWSDLVLNRKGPANLRLGSPDAGTVVPQILSVQGGSGTNIAGQDFTIQGSQSTGTGAGGSILFQVSPAGTAGTGQNTFETIFEVTGSGGITGQDGTTANTLAVRNGANAQTFRVYKTYDGTNNEWGTFDFSTESDQLTIGTMKSGSGNPTVVRFVSGGTRVAQIAPTFMQIDKDLYLTQNIIMAAKYTEMAEMTAPAAPAANKVRIYAEDDGAGKTRLMALFPTGAAQQIAIEP